MITSVLSKSNMISFLPEFVTAARVNAGELCCLDVRDMNISVYKQLIYHKNKWLSKGLKAFIEFIRNTEFSA